MSQDEIDAAAEAAKGLVASMRDRTPWETCSLSTKLERLREELVNLRRSIGYAQERAYSVSQQFGEHSHSMHDGKPVLPVGFHGAGGMGMEARGFDPLA